MGPLSQHRRRVAVTGVGVVTPIGIGKEAFWNALLEGRSGVRRIESFDPSPFPTQIAAEVRDFDPLQYMDRKEVRRNDRFVRTSPIQPKSRGVPGLRAEGGVGWSGGLAR